MQNLMIFGDSIMKGVMFSAERKRHTLLSADRRQLNVLLNQAGTKTQNYARFGACAECVEHAVETRLTEPQPDSAVLLSFGGNDCAYDWDAVAARPDLPHRPVTLPEDLASRWKDCIRIAKKNAQIVFGANLIPIDADKYFAFITQTRDREAILRWLGDVNMLYRWHESYCSLINDVCREENVTLIDLRRPFLLRHDYKDLICCDGMHPTQAGYDLLDETLVTSILSAA